MKRSLVILLCMMFAVTANYAKEDKKSKGKETVTFQVEGMDCNNCVKKIEKNIAFEKGVTDLQCDLSTRTAVVTYKANKTCPATLASAFKKIGMEAVPVGDDCCAAEKQGCCSEKKDGCGEESKNCCEGHQH